MLLLGEFPTSRGVTTTWQGQGNLRRSRITVTNRSAICSEGKTTYHKLVKRFFNSNSNSQRINNIFHGLSS